MSKKKRPGERVSPESRYNATGLANRLGISRTVFYKRQKRMQRAARFGKDVPPLLPPVRFDRISGGHWWTEADVLEWEAEGGHERARSAT